MKIYGADLSTPVIKVRMVANFLKIDYEYKKVDLRAGETRTEEFLRRHPAGKIPVIEDGSFVLFESNAIIRYLADKNNSEIYPKDLKQRALVDQWIDFGSMHVGNGMTRVLYNKVIAPRFGLETDERSLKDGLKFLEQFLPVVDNQLKRMGCLASEKLTLADFNLLATVDPLEAIGFDIFQYAHLKKWRDQLRTQEFYQKIHKFYGETMMTKR